MLSHSDLYKPNSRPTNGKGPNYGYPMNLQIREKMGVAKATLESQASNTSNQNSPCPLPASRPHPFVLFPPWQREPHQTPLFKLKTLEIFSPNSSSSLISESTLVSLSPLPLSQLNSVTYLLPGLQTSLESHPVCSPCGSQGFLSCSYIAFGSLWPPR